MPGRRVYMTKNEFLSILRDSLAGNVPSDVINENIGYYKDYIENNDKTESQVLEELGDPRLIARTIIDSFVAEKGPMADFYTKQAREEYRGDSSYTSSYDDDNYRNEYHHFSLKWYDKLLGIIIIVVVAMLVLALGAVAIGIFFRIILPLIVIYFIVKFIMERLT